MDWQGLHLEGELNTEDNEEVKTSQVKRVIIEYDPEPQHQGKEETVGSDLTRKQQEEEPKYPVERIAIECDPDIRPGDEIVNID